MLTQEFCEHLEYRLTTPLAKSKDIILRRCWCDGVLKPDQVANSVEAVKRTRRIITKAWIDEGKTKGKQRGTGKSLGQRLYALKIHFGEQSYKNFRNRQEFIDCIPDDESGDWLMFYFENKEIEIQLL